MFSVYNCTPVTFDRGRKISNIIENTWLDSREKPKLMMEKLCFRLKLTRCQRETLMKLVSTDFHFLIKNLSAMKCGQFVF